MSLQKWNIILILLLMGLQYKFWAPSGNFAEYNRLLEAKNKVELKFQDITISNEHLQHKIYNLKTNTDTMEELARFKLGMIKQGETFFQIIEPLE